MDATTNAPAGSAVTAGHLATWSNAELLENLDGAQRALDGDHGDDVAPIDADTALGVGHDVAVMEAEARRRGLAVSPDGLGSLLIDLDAAAQAIDEAARERKRFEDQLAAVINGLRGQADDLEHQLAGSWLAEGDAPEPDAVAMARRALRTANWGLANLDLDRLVGEADRADEAARKAVDAARRIDEINEKGR